VTDEQGFVASSFELLFDFIVVKRAAPFVLQVLHVAKPLADIGDALPKLPVGRDEDEVVAPESVGDDHLHGGGAATAHDDDLVAVFAGPRLGLHFRFRGREVKRVTQPRVQFRHHLAKLGASSRHHRRGHGLQAGLAHANGAGNEETVAGVRHGHRWRLEVFEMRGGRSSKPRAGKALD